MNQQWQPPSRKTGAGGGGSVKRARERMEAGLPPDMPRAPPQRPYEAPQVPIQSAPAHRTRLPMPSALRDARNGPSPVGVMISRPTQPPQWPLAGSIEGGPPTQPMQQYQPPQNRGSPPKRPPRPSQVPSITDINRMQNNPAQYAPQTQNQLEQQYEKQRREEEDMISPSIASPLTFSSRPSTSSVGSIPDFPVPVAPAPVVRKSANLGPPPSSRRGASSYWSQASFVSPIPEESPRTTTTHLSYASSAAMPTSWGSNSPPFYDDDDYEDERVYDDDRDLTRIEEGRESRGSQDDNDGRGLIRSASFGRRAKGTVVTTKSQDRIEPRPAILPQQKSIQMMNLERSGIVPRPIREEYSEAIPDARKNEMQRNMIWPIVGDADSPLANGTGLIDKSTSSSEERVPTLGTAMSTNEATPEFTDAKAMAMLGAYNAASSLQAAGAPAVREPSPGYSRMSAIRRPPRLDMDAVRDAEARGSLTSLPDLIRRATRLAAMMDRGKRPGSRLALNDYPSGTDLAMEKEMSIVPDEKHRSGLSGMLASFPPPGNQTPINSGTPTRPMSAFPAFDRAGTPLNPTQTKKPRRCCGLPCWAFLLLLILFLLIVAAAITVPILLLAAKPDATTAPTQSALQKCSTDPTTACQNGGSALLDNGSCACICTNGFTGSTCTSANATGCATVSLRGSAYVNVTLGESISRLIEGASRNFSIPLEESTILARFNGANLSCATENALVTFEGMSEREGGAGDVVRDPGSARRLRRQNASPTTTATGATATQNSIIFDPAAQPTLTPTSSAFPSATPSSTPIMSNSTAPFLPTQETLDFARVAVLYILQQKELESAIAAQGAIQKFLQLEGTKRTNLAAGSLSLGLNGNGAVVDLLGFRINLGEGNVGGRNVTAGAGKRSLGRRSVRLH